MTISSDSLQLLFASTHCVITPASSRGTRPGRLTKLRLEPLEVRALLTTLFVTDDGDSGDTSSDSTESGDELDDATADSGPDSATSSDSTSSETGTGTGTEVGGTGDTGSDSDDVGGETTGADDTSSDTSDTADDQFVVNWTKSEASKFWGSAGTLSSFECPDNEILFGLEGHHDTRLQGVRGLCGGLAYDAGGKHLVRAAISGTTQLLGRERGDAWYRPCELDEVVQEVQLVAADNKIPYLRLVCGKIAVDGDAKLSLDAARLLQPIGMSSDAKLGADCGTQAVASGIRVHVRGDIVAFGLLCRKPELVPQ